MVFPLVLTRITVENHSSNREQDKFKDYAIQKQCKTMKKELRNLTTKSCKFCMHFIRELEHKVSSFGFRVKLIVLALEANHNNDDGVSLTHKQTAADE